VGNGADGSLMAGIYVPTISGGFDLK
jgi:hypothetical protein